MKTLIVYDSTGNILFTKAPVEVEENFNYIISDIPKDRLPLKVENGEVILDDTEEVKEKKKKIEELNNEMLKLKQDLLDDMEENL